SYTAEADENVILDKISAIVNAEANADGKFEKVEITNGDAVVAAMSEVAAGSTFEIDVAVKYTLGEFTADRTYKLIFTRKASPETGKDPTAANIGTVYDENGIKISYAKKIEVDGKAILADGTGIHGGHESKVVRTPYGTFSVYVNDSRVDSDGIQWDKFTVIKISSDKFEVVFEAEYPHSQGSCAPNIFAGNGSTIYISIISVDQPKYVHQQRQEGAWLTIYEINAATNEYQSYQANPNFAVTGKGGYGYSQPIPDIENGKIYALYTGGDIPGQLAWFTFDINSHKWMPECRTVETEFRCCYFNAYADGNGGFIFVGQRDVKKSTFANLINNPAFGGSGYIQDIIYLFRVPDATKEEVISKMVRDPKYTSSTPLSGLISQRTYGTGCTYLDSDGNFHLLYSNTKGETSTLYHSVYDKELNVVSPDKSMLALFTTSKTTPRRLFMTQAPDGTFYIFASNVPKNAATAYTPAQFDIYKSSDGINFTRLIDTTVEIKTEDGTTFNCREMKFIVTAPRNNSTMDGTVGIMFYYPKTEGYSEYYDYYYMAIDFVN
ncbi:MAG: hypothetical protein HFE30_00005, partial [Clostridiales bacterium]|nr:hypothetical protein [Clostridiales bacterium]